MTFVIHHGNPGSYKTFTLVQRIGLEALKQGRVIGTNIRGFCDIEKIKEEFDIDIPDSSQIIYCDPDLNKAKSRFTMARWFHWLPQGALLLMDEGQKIYPTPY